MSCEDKIISFRWPSCDQQLERSRLYWPGRDLPAEAEHYEPTSASSRLLLVDGRSAEEYWDKLNVIGYINRCGGRVSPEELQPFNVGSYAARDEKPYWAEFDWAANCNVSLETLRLGCDQLAGVEVLAALMQCPGWAETLPNNPIPVLGGLYLHHNDEWWRSVYVWRNALHNQIVLDCGTPRGRWCVPTVTRLL